MQVQARSCAKCNRYDGMIINDIHSDDYCSVIDMLTSKRSCMLCCGRWLSRVENGPMTTCAPRSVPLTAALTALSAFAEIADVIIRDIGSLGEGAGEGKAAGNAVGDRW